MHDIVMRRFIRPLWNLQIAPATFSEAYEAVWDRTPERVAAAVTARMQAPDQPRDTIQASTSGAADGASRCGPACGATSRWPGCSNSTGAALPRCGSRSSGAR